MSRFYSAVVFLAVLGISVRVSDAVLTYPSPEVTKPEDATGDLTTVTATTGAASGNTVLFTISAQTGSLGWAAVAASGSNCVVSLASGKHLDYENANLVTGKKYEVTISAQEKNPSNADVGTAVTFKVTFIITDVTEFLASSLMLTSKENIAGGASVGSVTLEASGTGYTFAITAQTKDPGWFTMDSSGAIKAQTGQTVDYEDSGLTDHKYKVTVVASKTGSSSITATATITLTNTDDFTNSMGPIPVNHNEDRGEAIKLKTNPTNAAIALKSQTGDLGWFSLATSDGDANLKVLKVVETVDGYNKKLEATNNMYYVVLSVGTGATQGTGTVTFKIGSGAAAMLGNLVLTLGLLLLARLL